MSDPIQRLAEVRRSYELASLSEQDLAPTWFAQLERWIGEAVAAELPEPTAMQLATATADGRPGARTVLLRGLDERGLRFFTNERSRKGRELAENARAAVVFCWLELQRQVVVDAEVSRLGPEQSDAYWAQRPRGHRIGAVVSPQSEVVASRAELDRLAAEVDTAHPGEIPRPPHWGGYLLTPWQVEFWQGRRDRLHDRLRYRRERAGPWIVERLAP